MEGRGVALGRTAARYPCLAGRCLVVVHHLIEERTLSSIVRHLLPRPKVAHGVAHTVVLAPYRVGLLYCTKAECRAGHDVLFARLDQDVTHHAVAAAVRTRRRKYHRLAGSRVDACSRCSDRRWGCVLCSSGRIDGICRRGVVLKPSSVRGIVHSALVKRLPACLDLEASRRARGWSGWRQWRRRVGRRGGRWRHEKEARAVETAVLSPQVKH